MPKVPGLKRLNDGPWGLRRRVPANLQPILGKGEIWRSYGTYDFKEAKRRHPREMAVVEALFAEARRKLALQVAGGTLQPVARLVAPSEDDVRAAVDAWLHAELRKQQSEDASALDAEAVVDHLNEDEAHLAGEEGRDVAAGRLPAVLRSFGFDNPPPPLQRFALALMQRAMVEVVRRDRDHLEGMPNERVHDAAFAGIVAAAPPPPVPQPTGMTFGDLCDRYLSAPERTSLAPKTKLKYRGMVRVLQDLLGADTDASKITREDCRRAQALLLTVPANAAQRYPGLKAKDAGESAKRDGVSPMHPKSVGNHLDILATVLRWGARERVIRLPDGNPAEALNAATAKTVTAPAGEKRRPFTLDELKAIFAAPLYTGCKDDEAGHDKPGPNHPRRGRFWVPLLSLFAGLRLNEACQLRTDDVREVDGIPVLLIRASHEGQRLKTAAADRRIPVHPELARIGFLQLVARQRAERQARLFPELPAGKLGNYSDPFSKWFARFLEKAHVSSPGAVFHSFRHGFRDRMREAGIPSEVADALGGWAVAGQGAAYGTGFSVRVLAEHVARIGYPGLNLTSLHAPMHANQTTAGALPNSTQPPGT